MTTPETKMMECECGAYRLAGVDSDGKRTGWAAGCRACDRIRQLEELLDSGVRVRQLKSSEVEEWSVSDIMTAIRELEAKVSDIDTKLAIVEKRVTNHGHDGEMEY